MRVVMVVAVLAGCGGKDGDDEARGPFVLEDYCQATADCQNAFWSAYQPDTGPGITYDAETCVQTWDAQIEAYAGGPCEAAQQGLQDCIMNAENLVCVRGAYGSGACAVEQLDLSDCILGLYQ